jgi:hypothetical protein
MSRFAGLIMTARVPGAVAALGLLCATLMPAAQASPQVAPQNALPQTIQFNRDIRPILSDKCFKCHGPGTQMATVRFDLETGAKHELRGGRFAIVPGDPANSQVIKRITATDPAVRMPKSGTGVQPGEPLTPREIAMIQRWIEQGATWEKHWSFTPPTRPTLPAVKDQKWVRNPIDAFVLQRLEREGVKPSAQADRAVLLRRVTLDLTGLPPTPLELDAFLADTSPTAYEKVVDRLLLSPRYGERMAYPWLDAARYADSIGYQRDGPRFMWRWRDWVIDAFNRNMPYDQFTIEQLAGDLLPNPTLEQRIATGFNRNHRGNAENGVIAEEYAVEQVVDRVDTAGTLFLGMSIGCTRCHNHKYDPITAKEYYQLFAYFNNVPESGRARQTGNSPPFIAAPTSEQQPQLKRFDDALEAAKDKFAKLEPELVRAQQAWERSLDRSTPVPWGPTRGLVAHYSFDGELTPQVAVSRDGKRSVLEDGELTFVPAPIGQAASFDGKRFVQGGDIVGFEEHVYDPRSTVAWDDPYTLAAWIYPTAGTGAIVTKVQDVVEPNGHGLNLKDGKLQYNYVFKWIDAGIRLQTEKTLSLNQWHHVTLSYDGTRWASGVKVYVDGEEWKWEILLNEVNSQSAGTRREPLRIGAGGGPENRFKGSIDEVRIYNRALSSAEAAVLATPTPITEIAALAEDKRSRAQVDKIRDYFVERAAPAPIQAAWTEVIDAQERRNAFYQSLPTVQVMEEMPTPRDTHLLIRGAYDRPGEKVTPALPSMLTASPTAYPPNRLGLARWLVDPSNPLVARVTVNRFWQQYFGTGIVKSVENFGSQGDPPSHPELLDWLATEFIRTGWDVKGLQKIIVMSATYRQASSVTPAMLEKDPGNRLLARGPSLRLPAEMIRDQALALAGLLVDRIGGPSVKPYQPEGLWGELLSGASGEHDLYVQDHGDNLYRRSLYTYWKRAVPPPSMQNFDAPSRESHEVRVVVTNTPLQALNLMNDVAYVEAARMFAERIMREGGKTPPERIVFAFRAATARMPTLQQRSILLDAFSQERENYGKNPDAARKYVSHGEYPVDARLNVSELAAYTSVASLILNLNQTIVKE